MRILGYILLVSLIISCNYSSKTETISKSWNKDSTFCFLFNVKDTSLRYSINIIISNTDDYEYSNIYLLINLRNKSTSLNNTLNYLLSNDEGEWLGEKSFFDDYNSNLRYIEKSKFLTKGTHAIEIKHGMRQDNLKGIKKIGIQVITLSEK